MTTVGLESDPVSGCIPKGKGAAREFRWISSRKHSLTCPPHTAIPPRPHNMSWTVVVEGLRKSRALNSPMYLELGIFTQSWGRVAGVFQDPQPRAYNPRAQLALWHCCPSVRLWSNSAEAQLYSGHLWQFTERRQGDGVEDTSLLATVQRGILSEHSIRKLLLLGRVQPCSRRQIPL